ncbi:hypothetical protein SteCoe_36109 [Stentor coeruleus]|uniref:Uncharacterized protein n=1 Tax=Stentor coeruleus TaxID=5963 RepID=A0A1R2AQU9_9CILI|nr:hypothetical protein SteCoe_36109 [Stentor coeruleus]
MQDNEKCEESLRKESKKVKKITQVSDLTELIENSLQKNKDRIGSPSAIKPVIEKSPSPRVKYQSITRKIDFNNASNSPNFKEASKRKYENLQSTIKKVKKAYVEFQDPEAGKNVAFDCYPDKLIFENWPLCRKFSQNECDDDCATTKPLLNASIYFLISQVVEAIKSQDIPRKTV